MGYGIKWSDEEKEYLKKITPGHHYIEIANMMNKKFNREFTVDTIKNAIGRYKLNTGFNGRFKKGNVPHNKGKKGLYYKGCEKTWFKKGQVSINHKPVGSERIDVDGYTLIKVSEPNVWKLKHRVVWEKANGPIPKNYTVIFLDGDKSNTDINNLALVSRNELLIINQRGLLKKDKELSKVGINIAKLQSKINKRKRVKNK